MQHIRREQKASEAAKTRALQQQGKLVKPMEGAVSVVKNGPANGGGGGTKTEGGVPAGSGGGTKRRKSKKAFDDPNFVAPTNISIYVNNMLVKSALEAARLIKRGEDSWCKCRK
jgi:hypothetical protein